MPYFSIETNKLIDKDQNLELMKKATSFLSGIMNKPEQVIMVAIKPGKPCIFGGTDDPTAFVQVKSLGLEIGRCPEYSNKLCGFIENEMGIPMDRVFIDFANIDGKLFGYNGTTLAK